MEIEEKDISLLIAKKQNAEAYKQGIKDLEDEINEIQKRINLTIVLEEKGILKKEQAQKLEEIKNLKSTYDNKRDNIENEIADLKTKLNQNIEEFKGNLISKAEFNKLKENKVEKETELKECEKKIKKVKDALKDLIDKDGGYEQDTVSLSRKLDDLTAYKTFIKEEIDEIDSKTEKKFIIEEHMKEIEYIKYMKMRLSNLSYDSIEEWIEKEEKFQKEMLGEELEQDQEQPKQEPPKQEPPKQEPPKQDLPKQDLPKQEPPKQDLPKREPPKQEQYDKFSKDEVFSFFSTGENSTLENKGYHFTKEIKIDPAAGLATYTYIDNEQTKDEEVEIKYDNDSINNAIKLLKQEGFEIDNITEAIDPTVLSIVNMAEEAESEYIGSGISRYIDTLNNKGELKINYNLKDIYNSDLSLQEIRNIIRISKAAKSLNKNAVSIQRDSLLKRVVGNIKKRLEYNKNVLLGKGTDVAKKAKKTISKAKTKAVSLGEKTIGKLRIAGTTLRGYFKDKVNERKDGRSFVLKAKVDEKAAVEKVNGAKEQEEVIIENPDGTKTTGKRIWSIDEEVK